MHFIYYVIFYIFMLSLSYLPRMYVHNNHCHRVTAHFRLSLLLLLLLLLYLTAYGPSPGGGGYNSCI